MTQREFLQKLFFSGTAISLGVAITSVTGCLRRRDELAAPAEPINPESADARPLQAPKKQTTAQTVENNAVASDKQDENMIKKLELSNAEWKKRLSADEYYILRKEGTERPFTSVLNAEKRKGVYHCAGCDLELFTSEMKYDSGTGWPSFFTHIEGHLATKDDFKLLARRTEYHCVRCGGHHGHVFTDGPPPTHQRWCNNGIALKFIPAKA